jgi:hypothetical protein
LTNRVVILPRPVDQGPIPVPMAVGDDKQEVTMLKSEMKRDVWVSYNQGYNDGFTRGFEAAKQRFTKSGDHHPRQQSYPGQSRPKEGRGYRILPGVKNAPKKEKGPSQ